MARGTAQELEDKFLTRREATLLIDASAANLQRALLTHEAVHVAEREARNKAELGIDRRLEGMNEVRDQLRTQAATFVSRELYESDIDRLAGLIATEREARQRAEGSLATWRFIAGFLGLSGVVGLALGLVAVFGP